MNQREIQIQTKQKNLFYIYRVQVQEKGFTEGIASFTVGVQARSGSSWQLLGWAGGEDSTKRARKTGKIRRKKREGSEKVGKKKEACLEG